MAESLTVPNSQTQASPPAPAPAPPAPAPAPAAPAPAPAAPAPDPAADLAAINMILASPGHDRLPHLHPDRPPNTLCSTRDQSLEKIIYDQAQKIESQGNEISKLYKIVRHLASKDSTVADILQSEDVSSASGIGAIPFEFCSIWNRCMSKNRNKTQQSKMGENHTRMSRNGTPAASNNEF
ncbi:hypothetical protein YC2023_117406 [Brassica napus]